jgi:hypothetical protein
MVPARIPSRRQLAVPACRACGRSLHHDDNYCRKCGAAVDVFELDVVSAPPPGPVATLRAAAVPAVTSGASMIVAGALLRFALRQIFGRGSRRRLAPFGDRQLGAGEIEEIIYYRRRRIE